ncbi:MAG: TIGR03768 family metallophosphoesterase [Solidesulfovibrio sp.]|uniref:TIGR03768 family metallophosphoesterase n=1 Tax=Solidesulfovibrio sp. TaxID=2910990 RepID=UPI003158AFBC
MIMATRDSKRLRGILPCDDLKMDMAITRRNFMKYSAGVAAVLCLNRSIFGYAGTVASSQNPTYPIDSNVLTTKDRVLVFPAISPGLTAPQLPQIAQYGTYGYGNYTFGCGLESVHRTDIMPPGYSNNSPQRLRQLSSFFSISDIHITDKEAPNQFIYNQQAGVYSYQNSSIYSPVMLCTTQVLDAVIQTINALHKQTPFDFGISLGDVCNTAQHNELRWYINVIDGQVITPCSGDHIGNGTIDYQKTFQAAGLDPSIPWYQVLGNHDHFWLGVLPVDAESCPDLRGSYTSGSVMASGLLAPANNGAYFPCMFDVSACLAQQTNYMGLLNGLSVTGAIIDAGPVGDYSTPPTVPADSDRYAVTKTQWMQEFFTTTTTPVGHGFNLVDPAVRASGFACYSFMPKSNIPLKIIVLDDTQSDTDGSHDIHGHGFLDAARWSWLQAELAAGQAANQLMIVAAHIPIGVAVIGGSTEWWEPTTDPNHTENNAVTLTGLVNELWNTPNLLMWIAGHRHKNAIKAFPSPDSNAPEKGFWQVETSSLRDFPQQFRTFQIYLNTDYTVSIVATNVDPAVANGTPAATSRYYAIATEQILQSNLTVNGPNDATYNGFTLETMDPSRPQDGSMDPTIKWPSVTGYGPFPSLQSGLYGSAVNSTNSYPSYNAELFKQLSPTMISVLKKMFPYGGIAGSVDLLLLGH